MPICGDGAYPRAQPATVEQASRQQITSSLSAPSIVHQMVSMAWLMLMQMQQLVSGFSASSQRSISFFFFYFFFVCLFHTHKKKNKWNNTHPISKQYHSHVTESIAKYEQNALHHLIFPYPTYFCQIWKLTEINKKYDIFYCTWFDFNQICNKTHTDIYIFKFCISYIEFA